MNQGANIVRRLRGLLGQSPQWLESSIPVSGWDQLIPPAYAGGTDLSATGRGLLSLHGPNLCRYSIDDRNALTISALM